MEFFYRKGVGMDSNVWYRPLHKAIWHVLKQYLIAGFLGFVAAGLPYLFAASLLFPKFGSRVSFTTAETAAGLILFSASFFLIFRWLYFRRGDLKKPYLESMQGKDYNFAADVKTILQGPMPL